jgi:glycosyltransferase involved in cell wall biosynthesis
MKILSINKFNYIFGGSDRYYFELNELHQKAGHQVIHFSMQHPENLPSPYSDDFVSHVDFWNTGGWVDQIKSAGRILYSREARHKIANLIERTKPDIAHIHLIYHQITQAIVPILKEHGIPVVQTLHDYKPICPTYRLLSNGAICERCKGKKFYHAALQRCNNGKLGASLLNSVEMYLHHSLKWYDLPDIYHAPSKFLLSKMVEFGMPERKFIHLPLFIDPDKFTFSEHTENYFVYFGRLAPVKGVKTLIEAMAKIKKPDSRLLIIGDGPQRAELENLTSNLSLKNVEFLGYRTSDDLRRIVSGSLFSIYPSEWYENLPLSVMESMAMGKPVIAAEIGGIPELINHGEDGMLFKTKDADQLADTIQSLLSDPERCRKMGRAARDKIVARFNPPDHHREILKLYNRLLSPN